MKILSIETSCDPKGKSDFTPANLKFVWASRFPTGQAKLNICIY